MSNKDVFGKIMGFCDGCLEVIYENDIRYYVKHGRNAWIYCKNCVKVVDPKKR